MIYFTKYKSLKLFDSNSSTDNCTVRKTRVLVRDIDTQEEIYTGSNKIVVAGAAFTAAKHWNLTPPTKTPSYNTILGLENTVVEPFNQAGIRREEQIFLFAVGTDGCGTENSQVYKVDYASWIKPESLVPIRYQLDTNDLGATLRDKYFGRKVLPGYIAYYFKGFDNTPEILQQYIDGTPIDENIYLSGRNDEVETYVRAILRITKDDCRDFFKATTGINDARINTVSLLTAWKKEINGFVYYQDIRPVGKFNFPNEALIDVSKGVEILYDMFY